jgi:DNA-binding transcriptional MerR regulator
MVGRKGRHKRPQTQNGKPLLKMQELTKATGVPKSTILHYVNEGLLPEPVKTSPNMAYYDPDSVERIRFIKSMQNNHRLPLTKIKSLIRCRDEGQDITLRTLLSQTIFGRASGEMLDRSAYCRATGLTSEQVDDLTKADMLLPLESGLFDEEDVGIGNIYAEGLSRGMTVDDMDFYPKLAKQIVDEEMRLRRRLTHHLPEEVDAGLSIQLVQTARAIRTYVIDRLFQLRVAGSRSLKDEDLLS